MHLGFEDVITALFDVEGLSDLVGLLGNCGYVTFLDKHFEFPHEIFALVLVEIEAFAEVEGESFGEEGCDHFGQHKIF